MSLSTLSSGQARRGSERTDTGAPEPRTLSVLFLDLGSDFTSENELLINQNSMWNYALYRESGDTGNPAAHSPLWL